MADGELAQQVMENVVQIGSRGERVEVLLVFFFAVGRIDAVQIRVVKIAALDAPHFVIHLLPFGDWIDAYFHVSQLECAFAGLERRGGGDDDIVGRARGLCTSTGASCTTCSANHPQQHLLTVGGEIERSDAIGQFIELAGLQIIFRKRRSRTAWTAQAACRGFDQINHARFAGH